MRIIAIACIALIYTMTGCRKDDVNPADVDNINLAGDTWVKDSIDRYIDTNYVNKYNILIKYKWDQFEADLDKTLVPPKEAVVVPILKAIQQGWINTYIAESSTVFFNKYSPKFITLIGSVAYESDGSYKLGTAEGGRKVLIYGINNTRVKGMPGYKLSDSASVKELFHIIHHEFGHILHQNILYPLEFKNLNSLLYTGDWINYSDAMAQRDGFISAYAMNVADDDFVETISIMLIEGRAGFEKIIAGIPTGVTDRGTTQAQAIARLRTKESIVVNYFKQAWNIDFYSLQTRTRAAIAGLIY